MLRSLENDYGLREVSAWPIQPLHMHCAVLEVPAGTDRRTVLDALSHDQRIRLAQPLQDFSTRTEDYNDPYVQLQRGFKQMEVAEAHPWSRGDGVKVAIIDTGADTQHADLRGSILAAANFVDSDDKQFQRDRHGTEVAGVIAAVANNREGIVGVAPGARLLVLKACWQVRLDADAARCNSFTLARALVAAFDARAQIINMSLAGPADPLLNELMREGMRRGVLFVGAAADPSGGKEGLLHQPGVIEVASAGSRPAQSSVLFAPGREILTLLPGGHYDFASGDSIATAQVSGVVALLLAKNSGLSAAEAYRPAAQYQRCTPGRRRRGHAGGCLCCGGFAGGAGLMRCGGRHRSGRGAAASRAALTAGGHGALRRRRGGRQRQPAQAMLIEDDDDAAGDDDAGTHDQAERGRGRPEYPVDGEGP